MIPEIPKTKDGPLKRKLTICTSKILRNNLRFMREKRLYRNKYSCKLLMTVRKNTYCLAFL